MYSFEPSEEQSMLIEAINRYSISDLRPQAHDADENSQLPEELVEKGWELGYLQASIPEEYYGFGEHSALTGVLAGEELAYGDLAGALAVFTPNLFVIPILLCGSDQQKNDLIPEVIEAEWKPYCSALIEPYIDFDPNELKTTATSSNGGFEINGKKTYVPYADKAGKILVFASLDGKTQGFIVVKDTKGLIVEEQQKLMGIRGIPLYNISFENVFIPNENRLGGFEGHDFEPILTMSRLATASMAVGLSRAAFEYSRDYAKEREVFGVKVAQKQAIAFMLAEMAIEIEAIRLLTWESAWMFDKGIPDATVNSILALNGAIDMAVMVTDRAVQILGGHGYIREHPVELWMRNGNGLSAINGLALI